MKIETKYDIGHIFWAPRCYERFEQEKIVWDGEEWYRDKVRYEAIAKEKQIVAINVQVHESADQEGTVFGWEGHHRSSPSAGSYCVSRRFSRRHRWLTSSRRHEQL